jgi:tRNA threonylcarbamoyladenosine biosynthesis protein TsaB
MGPNVRVLAIETSGRVGSIAALEVSRGQSAAIDERWLPPDQRTARSLLPTIHSLLSDHAWRPGELDMVCTTTGPGSFTGLRIGVVAAKTLCYATGAALVGVHTLSAIASAVDAGRRRLWTVLDAQRKELFVACFEPGLSIVDQAAPPTQVLGVDDWLARLAAGDAVAGPPLARLRHRIVQGVQVIDEQRWTPTAAAAGRLAIELLARGSSIDPLMLVPRYYRKSAAEEKANAKEAPS